MRTNRRRKTRKKKKARRNGQTAKQKAASKRNLKKARAARKRGASPNRKRRRATTNRKRRPAKRRATSNRKRRAAPNRKRRTAKKRRVRRNRKRGFIFLRNQANGFMKNFMEVLRVGGAVTVGFVAQKAMTHLLADTGILDKLPGADNYKNTYAGLLTAALGVPIFAKVAPGESKLIGSGIGAGFLHTALVDMLNAFGQGDIADYLGNYANAEGNPQYSGYGSYYEFAPHQVYSGTGEYYETGGGMSGFGQMSANQLTQAAAGYGASPQIYQAAAAYPGVPQLYQDAAGMGAAPVLTQAAAGVGEYIVNGGKGIGEYEEVVPQYSAPTHTDEGISPDLTSAERALSVAEAAAGVGAFGDNQVPLQSTVYPTGSPEAIPDMPGGSRAGTFAGNNGVFGPTQ
jgi:hypothetical protein